MKIAPLVISIFFAYLIGSVPTSVWIGRIFYKIDVRSLGSGNAGATNTIRVLGYKAGIPVLIFDIFKGWLAVYIANFFWQDNGQFPDLIDLKIILAISAVIGHVFPLYVGFKGGKGIATLLGVGIALYPLGACIAVAVFVITLSISGYVSVSSIIASVLFPFIEVIILGHYDYMSLVMLSFAIAIFVPLTHRKNISRLMKGQESKFILRRKKS